MEQDFRLCRFNFNEKERPRIQKIQSQLDQFALDHQIPDFFTNFSPNFLDSLPLKSLEELQSFKSILDKLEDIHFKTMRATEYKTIKDIQSLLIEKLEFARQGFLHLEEVLRKNYSLISNDNSLLSLLYPYSSFKDFSSQLLNPDHLTINQLLAYKSGNFFEICRQGILQNQVGIIPQLLHGGIINLPDLCKQHPKIYELLAGEFFFQLQKELIGGTTFTGKTYSLEFIRPAHPMAEQFKLAPFEGALLALSLNPLPDVGMKPGDKVNFFDLAFEVKDPGVEGYKIDIHWPLCLNSTSYVITCPVYFGHYRLQLIANQRLRSVS